VYLLPKGQTSAIYQNIPGIPVVANDPVNNSLISPSLGRNVVVPRRRDV
jgi:hypothetical protein